MLTETSSVPLDLPSNPLLNSFGQYYTELKVETVLKRLVMGKASGPNDLINRIPRELSSELAIPFWSLFNQSLRSGTFAGSYKEANVYLYKGDLSIVSNYRHISLLNSEGKLFERLVFKYSFNHFQDDNLLFSLESGFILDSGKEIQTVFCDISKAFDRV